MYRYVEHQVSKSHFFFWIKLLTLIGSMPLVLSGCEAVAIKAVGTAAASASHIAMTDDKYKNPFRELSERPCPSISQQLLKPASIHSEIRKLNLTYQVPLVRLLSGKEDKWSPTAVSPQPNTYPCFLPDGVKRNDFELALSNALVKAGYTTKNEDNHNTNVMLIASITEQNINTGSLRLAVEYQLIAYPSKTVLLSKSFKASRSYHDTLFAGKFSPALYMELQLSVSESLDFLLNQLSNYEKSSM